MSVIWECLKKRLILLIGIGYFSGIFLANFVSDRAGCPVPLYTGGFLLVISILWVGSRVISGKRRYIKIFLFVIPLFMGCTWFAAYRHDLEKSMSRIFDQKLRMTVRMKEASYRIGESAGGRQPEKGEAILEGYWKEAYIDVGRKIEIILPDHARYGEVMTVTGTVIKPLGARNQGMYDERQVLYGKGCAAVLQVNSIESRKMSEGHDFFLWWSEQKEEIIRDFRNMLPLENAGLLCSFLLGYKNDLDPGIKQDFSDSGLSHLMAVSGMNVGFILLISMLICKICGLRQKARCMAGILALTAYTMLLGFSPPVVRAVIIAVIILLGRVMGRQEDMATSMAFSALVLGIICPTGVFDLGFQLTFAACIGILVLNKGIFDFLMRWIDSRFVAGSISISVSAQLATFPLIVSVFHQTSLVSALGTFYLTPVLGMTDFLGISLITFYKMGHIMSAFVRLLSYVTNYIMEAVRSFVSWCASLDYSYFYVPAQNMSLYFIYYLILVLMGTRKKLKISSRSVAAVLLISVLFMAAPRFWGAGQLTITMLDVGQGDCILIRTPQNKTILIDGGTGKVSVADCLFAMGIQKIDIVMITHSDSDHMDGAAEALEKLRADIVYVNQAEPITAFEEMGKNQTSELYPLGRGDHISLSSDCSIDILSPSLSEKEGNADTNDRSLVAKLRYRDFSALFMGDAGTEVEKQLIDMDIKNTTVLKIGHHGSKSSTSEEFLDQVSPYIAMIGVGKNMYGHPAKEVMEKLEKRGINIYRTDLNGAVSIETDGHNVRVSCMLTPSPCEINWNDLLPMIPNACYNNKVGRE